jgi:hypothetical protein
MKTAALTSLLVLSALVFSHAQLGVCTPDPSYQGSMGGIFPLPYDPVDNPTGGIQDSACLNQNFQFVFTVIVPDTLQLGPTMMVIDSFHITNVTTLPSGFSYACNTPDCSFPGGQTGCLAIFGNANAPEDIGPHPIVIHAKMYTGGIGVFMPFPSPFQYPSYLYILPEDSPNCSIFNSAFELNSAFGPLHIFPNPFTGQTAVEIYSRQSGDCRFRVFDLMGRTVHNQNLRMAEGLNIVPFNGENLPEGLYLCSFTDGASVASGKMIVRK